MTKIRAYKEFTTNIKGLPYNPDTPETNQYLTQTGYSQTYPYKVVRKTATTMTLKMVKVAKDPDWKPEIVPGGFAGHCTNQSEQTWLYDGIEGGHEVVVRLKKSRYAGSDKLWGDKHGNEFIANGARYFYDYNF